MIFNEKTAIFADGRKHIELWQETVLYGFYGIDRSNFTREKVSQWTQSTSLLFISKSCERSSSKSQFTLYGILLRILVGLFEKSCS